MTISYFITVQEMDLLGCSTEKKALSTEISIAYFIIIYFHVSDHSLAAPSLKYESTTNKYKHFHSVLCFQPH